MGVRILGKILKYFVLPAALFISQIVQPVFAQQCDRACLEGFVDQFMAAQHSHSASGLPLAANFRYTENGQDIEVDDGLWLTYSKHSSYRLFVADPYAGQVAFIGVIEEGDTPVIIHYRMKVAGMEIAEVEVLIARGGMGALENLETPKSIFTESVPKERERNREQMVAITNSYFTGLDEENSGANVPFHPDCQRQENGMILANSPDPDAGAMQKLGCKAQFDTGFSTIVTDIRERRFMVLDEERGLGYAIVFFDHDGTPETMGGVGGEIRAVRAPFNRPMTFMIGELFKIVDGQIRQIEAIIVTVPYGMPSGWDGEDLISQGLL